MRTFFIALVLMTIVSEPSHADELSDTLAWIDNTYNSHPEVTNAPGHGHAGWYAPDKSNGSGEHLVSGSFETFTYDGCHMTLSIQDDPKAEALSEARSTKTYSFSLRDINPQSIETHLHAHFGDSACYKSQIGCDHAEIVFFTHIEAPLIDEDWDIIYPKLKGNDHESKQKNKGRESFFEVDDPEYAGRLMTAFRHAVELCGGKPDPF